MVLMHIGIICSILRDKLLLNLQQLKQPSAFLRRAVCYMASRSLFLFAKMTKRVSSASRLDYATLKQQFLLVQMPHRFTTTLDYGLLYSCNSQSAMS